MDAVAVGQITAGPVFTTATFIGYLVGGVRGAIVATIGIFLPGFAAGGSERSAHPADPTFRIGWRNADGVIVWSLALMACQLSRAALVDPLRVAIACWSAAPLLAFRVNVAWLVLAAAIIGVIHGA